MDYKYKYQKYKTLYLNLKGGAESYFNTHVDKVPFQNAQIDEAIARVSTDGSLLEGYPQYFSNKDVVMAAVNNTSNALQFVDDKLKKDKEFMFWLIEKKTINPYDKYNNVKFFRDNEYTREFITELPEEMLRAIATDHSLFPNVTSLELYNDHDFIVKAININPTYGWNILRGRTEFVNNPSAMLEVIRANNTGNIFKYASGRLQADKKFVKYAIQANPRVIQVIRKQDQLTLLDIYDLLSIARRDWSYIKFINPIFLDDTKVVKQLLIINMGVLNYVSERLKTLWHQNLTKPINISVLNGDEPLEIPPGEWTQGMNRHNIPLNLTEYLRKTVRDNPEAYKGHYFEDILHPNVNVACFFNELELNYTILTRENIIHILLNYNVSIEEDTGYIETIINFIDEEEDTRRMEE